MGFQTSVNFKQSWGVAGTIFGTAPKAVYPYILDSSDQTNNVFGYAYIFKNGTNTVQAGNPANNPNAAFAGYLVNPNNFALQGNASGSLEPTFYLPNGTLGTFLREGEIIVKFSVTVQANIGDNIWFNNTNGSLNVFPKGTAGGAGYSWGYAEVIRTPILASLYAIVRVSPDLIAFS